MFGRCMVEAAAANFSKLEIEAETTKKSPLPDTLVKRQDSLEHVHEGEGNSEGRSPKRIVLQVTLGRNQEFWLDVGQKGNESPNDVG